MKSNLWKYKLYSFLDLFWLFAPILTIHFIDMGLSLSQIAIITSITWVVSLIMEVPSGIIADLYGYKTTLIISSASYLIWVFFLAGFQSFGLLVLSGVFLGIKISFKSGSGSALLYDSLIQLKREKEFAKINGKSISLMIIGMAVSSPIGSMLAGYFAMGFVLKLMTIVAFISLVVACLFIEPKTHTKKFKPTFKGHFIDSWDLCKKKPVILSRILIYAMLTTLFVITFNFMQVLMKSYNIPLSWFGWIYFVFVLTASIGSMYYHKLLWIREKKLTMFLSFGLPILVISLFAARIIYVFILLLLIIEFMYGIVKPAKEHILNVHIDSKSRATILSLLGLVTSILISVFQPIFGYIGDLYGIFVAFALFGSVSFAILVYFWSTQKSVG
ncbi:hypothetical protein COV93_06035 [Candidatus Woesearchaeota archaeon CG11_big_fil_rev_8_21_14_0_20_43_8]|nr:MAG: hypothetical protein COV93_06035 [Candidatus Woesearchaeota archaeon CG11_big_fil_rev_8_21_14_0_20_43_8]